jgi:hypothetical protein
MKILIQLKLVLFKILSKEKVNKVTQGKEEEKVRKYQ